MHCCQNVGITVLVTYFNVIGDNFDAGGPLVYRIRRTWLENITPDALSLEK
jgi:hypothetical protein